ncbi:MAG: hypothetical protein M3Q56_09170 [Bacteroidota bacterium]|nr:hypothetical protein [Bacteroidota bacterium]
MEKTTLVFSFFIISCGLLFSQASYQLQFSAGNDIGYFRTADFDSKDQLITFRNVNGGIDVIKMNSNGKIISYFSYKFTNTVIARGIKVDKDGNVLITGNVSLGQD